MKLGVHENLSMHVVRRRSPAGDDAAEMPAVPTSGDRPVPCSGRRTSSLLPPFRSRPVRRPRLRLQVQRRPDHPFPRRLRHRELNFHNVRQWYSRRPLHRLQYRPQATQPLRTRHRFLPRERWRARNHSCHQLFRPRPRNRRRLRPIARCRRQTSFRRNDVSRRNQNTGSRVRPSRRN